MGSRVESELEEAASRWNAGGGSPSTALAGARLTAHWAAQIVAAAGWTLAPPSPDDSHGSLEWSDAEGALLGVELSRAGRRARAGLRLADLTLLVTGGERSAGAARSELALSGQTLGAGLSWLATALTQELGVAIPQLERPRHELPASPVGRGAPFDRSDSAALGELADWYASADRVLRAIRARTTGAEPVRCWPHHFDLATLIHLDPPDPPKERARSIGMGLSPGDAGIPEPYWYVTPWPYTGLTTAPILPAGHWQTQGWTGAALTACELAAPPTAAPGARVAAFLAAALEACRALLDGGSVVTDR
jgi:hypothetical protein